MDTSKPLLEGRCILMTGGSSGIGGAVANALIRSGAHVFITSRHHPDEWENSPPSDWDEEKYWLSIDFLNTADTEQKVEKWLQSNGANLDALLLFATTYGYGSRHSLIETSLEEWNELFMVNTYAPFIITKLVLKHMLQRPKGMILSITSDTAFLAGPGRIGYAASKSALHSLFIGLAEELKGSNISVIEMLPNRQVDTPGLRKRRPTSFDFSSYASATCFVNPVCSLIETLGGGFHGQCLTVDHEGNFFLS